MAITLPAGFRILNNEPVDARLTLADESTRYALSSANVYEGLIVYQQDNDTVWVLTDTSNVGNSNGWTQLQIGSVSSNLPSGVVSGSDQLTSSYDSRYVNETDFTSFSSSIDSRLDIVEEFSSSIDNTIKTKMDFDGVVSGSSQIILQDTTGLLSGSRIDGLVLSSSYAISSSHSEFADDSLNSTYSQNTITTGKNLHNTTIAKGTPLYFTASGTAGNLVGVFPADAGDPSRMPAGGIAGEELLVGAEGIVLLDGFISEVDTSVFASGDEIFVAVGGGYTNVAPTGSALIQHLGNVEKSAVNGSGVIQMMGEVRGLPNIQEGYLWVGDSNGVPQAVTTQSVVEHIFTQNNTFTGTQTFDNIAVNGTGSFAYIQSVTGSAKIIGDAYIILNNNTPSERYAGIAVYDSGSVIPTTASLNFDGQTNDWFYEYSASTVDYGVVLFGPEYNTKGNPTYLTANRIPKAEGTHHLNDSNITDTGTLITLGSNTIVTGTFYATGTPLVSGSSQISYPNLSNIPAGIVSGSSQVNADSITNFDTNVKDKLNADAVVSGSSQITKTLQEVTTAGNTTSTSISITNTTASTSKTTGALIVSGGIGTSGGVFAGGDIVAYASSDIRLKDNILPIQNPLQKINQIGGYSFNWNEEKQHIYKGKDYGVIAQEIEQILPELVETRENGYKAVKYDKLVSLLIEGIKDLSKQVEDLKEKINKG